MRMHRNSGTSVHNDAAPRQLQIIRIPQSRIPLSGHLSRCGSLKVQFYGKNNNETKFDKWGMAGSSVAICHSALPQIWRLRTFGSLVERVQKQKLLTKTFDKRERYSFIRYLTKEGLHLWHNLRQSVPHQWHHVTPHCLIKQDSLLSLSWGWNLLN